jgi:hypothetical protein
MGRSCWAAGKRTESVKRLGVTMNLSLVCGIDTREAGWQLWPVMVATCQVQQPGPNLCLRTERTGNDMLSISFFM